MWEDQEEDEEEEEDGLAGQLLSDILATSKYGKPFEKRAAMLCTFSVHWSQEAGCQRKGGGGPTRDVPWASLAHLP